MDTKAFWLAYLKIDLLDKNWKEVVRVLVLVDMMQEDAYGYVVRCRYQNNASEGIASIKVHLIVSVHQMLQNKAVYILLWSEI